MDCHISPYVCLAMRTGRVLPDELVSTFSSRSCRPYTRRISANNVQVGIHFMTRGGCAAFLSGSDDVE